MSENNEQAFHSKKGFTTGEVAELCHVTIPTVIKWIDSGELVGFKIPGSKNRRITRDNLLTFMKKHSIPTKTLEETRTKILVVDDCQEILEIIDGFLNKDEFETRLVSKGFEAGIAKEFQPDLIILDILLPDIDGRKVCEYIREMPESKNIAILAISGFIKGPEELNELFAIGFDDYLVKPFGVKDLLEKVNNLLSRRKKK